MRHINPRVFPLLLFGGVLLLSLLGGAAGVASFLLLRAGYGFMVWGLPFLALLLGAVVLSAAMWWAAGGTLPGIGRRGASEERTRGDDG
jgi:hypothetical protein